MSDIKDLQNVRDNLKRGEYKGTDIMEAWLAIEELIALRAIIEQDNVEPVAWEYDEYVDYHDCSPYWTTTIQKYRLDKSEIGTSKEAIENRRDVSEPRYINERPLTYLHPPKDSTETADSDFENKVIVDKSDLFDFVRGAIKDALDHDAEEERNEAHLWSDAHDRTVECLTKVYGSENPEPASKDAERYQWLRKNGCKFPDYVTGAMTGILDEEDLDAAVDFNIKESS